MTKIVLLNIVMNFVLGAVFVFLNNQALHNNLEETFVALALLYAIIVVVGNAFYIYIFCRKHL